MSISNPYYRIYRPSLHASCFEEKTFGYAQDSRFIELREKTSLFSATKLILKDYSEILEYVEPCDANLLTYSHRIYELLLRTCTEVETNLEGILNANGYSKSDNRNLNMHDYCKVDSATKLSEYSVVLHQWHPDKTIHPFEGWKHKEKQLPWYRDYNKVKHGRSKNFDKANLENLSNAIGGLLCILYAQFGKAIGQIDNIPEKLVFSIEEGVIEIGQFDIMHPVFSDSEKYDFDWNELEGAQCPYSKYDF